VGASGRLERQLVGAATTTLPTVDKKPDDGKRTAEGLTHVIPWSRDLSAAPHR
jgi:hypothetical protein